MSKYVAEEIKPYLETYSDLVSKYDECMRVGENDDDLIMGHIEQLPEGADLEQDETTQLFVGMAQDAYDSAAEHAEKINALVSEVKNPEMIHAIRASRLALIKRLDELDLKKSEMKNLSDEISSKVLVYSKTEDVSEEIASIMLKAGDKGFRAKCLKLSEWENEVKALRHELDMLSALEREATGLIIPGNMLDKYVNGNTPK